MGHRRMIGIFSGGGGLRLVTGYHRQNKSADAAERADIALKESLRAYFRVAAIYSFIVMRPLISSA